MKMESDGTIMFYHENILARTICFLECQANAKHNQLCILKSGISFPQKTSRLKNDSKFAVC